MTFLEGLIVWTIIFAFCAISVMCFVRGATQALARPGIEDAVRRETVLQSVRAQGINFLAASVTMVMLSFALLAVSGMG